MTQPEASDSTGSETVLDQVYRRNFVKTIGAVGTAGVGLTTGNAAANGDSADESQNSGQSNFCDAEQPNIVVFFADDMGYGDIGCFGNPFIHTPNLDQMAAEGAKFTNYTCEGPVCTPARSALLTGSYPKRTGMHDGVVFPRDNWGLDPEEETIADVLSDAGYATGAFGKWHLGHRDPFLPTNQGFDTYFGTPYSNDMLPEHILTDIRDERWPELPLIRDGKVIEYGPDQGELTRRLTEAAKDFITENQDDPFFTYIPYPMPHLPIYASEEFRGTSKRGLFGDVIQELDWGVGQILNHLEELGLDEDTLMVFTTDDGPWEFAPDWEMWYDVEDAPVSELTGNTGSFRGAKQTTWEGGLRTPCIMRWPSTIPENTVCQEMTSSMDFFPTFANLAGANTSLNRIIDGNNIRSLMENPIEGNSPHHILMHYEGAGPESGELSAVRHVNGWKYLFPIEGDPEEEIQVRDESLHNIYIDISEENNRIEEKGQLAKSLQENGEAFDKQLEETSRGPATSEEGDIGLA